MAVLCTSGLGTSGLAVGVDADQLTPRELEAFAARLTARELEVFGQLAAGRDRRGIARILGVSPHTVRTHIQKIFVKLDVHSVIEALALLRAAERGHSNAHSNGVESSGVQANTIQPSVQWACAPTTRSPARTRSAPA